MKFEEDFPSLNNMAVDTVSEYIVGEGMIDKRIFSQTEIEKYCLDKQKVKEKFALWLIKVAKNNFILTKELIDDFQKELGLE